MSYVLFVDDERDLGTFMSSLLRAHGHDVRCAVSAEAAIEAMRAEVPNLVLLDLHVGEADGMDLLRRFRTTLPDVPVVMVTGYGNVQTAVAAMKAGAVDFVTKPFDNNELMRTLDRLLAMSRSTTASTPVTVAGQSVKLKEVLANARRFAGANINVLLHGETGTGKEVFARAIHAASKLRDGPFIAVDCSTLTESLFEGELFGHERGAFTGALTSRSGRLEQAQGGTLFLDEIGNLPISLQPKLLRVLQERCFVRVGGRETIRLDARIVSATNVNLAQSIREGRFREDLYYRLNEVRILLPALREREGDVSVLAKHFIELHATRFGKPIPSILVKALQVLESHTWPGNVRQLENVIKAAVVMADDIIDAEHVRSALYDPYFAALDDDEVADSGPVEKDDGSCLRIDVDYNASEIDLHEVCAQAERAVLSMLVDKRRLRLAHLAKLLNIDPKTLRVKLRKYGLHAA